MEQITQPPTIKGNPQRCVFLIVVAVGLILASERWFFPWLHDFSARAHCEEVLGFNGSLVLFASLFIGLTFGFLASTLWVALISWRVFKSGQMPPPGTWVCRDTVPKTGRFVRWRAYFGLALPLIGLALFVWGILAFADLKEHLLDPGLERVQETCGKEDKLSREGKHQAPAHPGPRSLSSKR